MANQIELATSVVSVGSLALMQRCIAIKCVAISESVMSSSISRAAKVHEFSGDRDHVCNIQNRNHSSGLSPAL
jgi:hypothetical protein